VLEKLSVEGGVKLKGKVNVSGAKNAALPLIAASILSQNGIVLKNVPQVEDVKTMLKALSLIGMDYTFEKGNLTLTPKTINPGNIPYDIVRKMRASVLLMGPVLGRFGESHVYTPGGCAIGARPIDLHIEAFKKMGAKHRVDDGFSHLKTKGKLTGGKIVFDKVTVTGTENVIMAAVLAKGETVIENAATEPEITDLCNCLTKMGANIQGAGTKQIVINGVKNLNSCTHTVIPDRIEAGTYVIAAAITCSEVEVTNCNPTHLDFFLEKLIEAGVNLEITTTSIKVKKSCNLKAVNIKTAPYPGFPTDLQAQFMTLMTIAKGVSHIKELIFENRFQHALELKRMGANIELDGNLAIVKGSKNCLKGANVMATDLRASASLVLAAIAAKGKTDIHRIYHLDRGYENLDQKLTNLGAKIKRERDS
jgi:UDP-N-acetylglucosamine 1-carboxyvinyltransferase